MPITITGPLEDSAGNLVTGEVKFQPYPFRGGKGTAKTAESASKMISGTAIAQQFTDGEPDYSESESGFVLALYAGTYQVKHGGTILYQIVVPTGTDTRKISELVNDTVEGPPSVDLGLPSTAGADPGDVPTWDGSAVTWKPSGTTAWGSIIGTLSDQSDLQAALNAKVNALTATAVVYVSKQGADANSGLNIGVPKLTISAAIAVAEALVLAGASTAKVHVLDADTYTESLALTESVFLHAPAVRLVGEITMENFCGVELNEHYASAGGVTMLQKEGGSGHGFYHANRMDGRGIGGALTGVDNVKNVSNGSVLFVRVGVLYVTEDGVGVSDSGNNFGHIHFWTPDLYLAGDNAIGINAATNRSNFIGYVDHILEFGSPAGGVGILVSDADAVVKITVSEIVCETAYAVSAGELYIQCPKVTGIVSGVVHRSVMCIPVSSLPSSPVVGQIYRLTASDAAYRAPTGLYIASSAGWKCLAPSVLLADNVFDETSITVVPGARYSWGIISAKPAWSVTFTAPGVVVARVYNAVESAVAVPTINGATPTVLYSGGWDDAAVQSSTWYLEWDGAYAWVAAKEFA